MVAIRSVFDKRWRVPCAAAVMALCCNAQASASTTEVDGLAGTAKAPAWQDFEAPKTAGERRCPEADGCATDEPTKTGYLLGIKKFFGAERLFSRLGIFGYGAVRRDDQEGAGTQPESAVSRADGTAFGRTSGYSLNLQPLPRIAADARYGWNGLTYIARDDLPLRQGLTTRGLKYSLYFDDCARLEGLYGRSSGQERYGLGFAQDNWSVSLASGAGDARMALHVGYAIPLGQTGGTGDMCKVTSTVGSRSFGLGSSFGQ